MDDLEFLFKDLQDSSFLPSSCTVEDLRAAQYPLVRTLTKLQVQENLFSASLATFPILDYCGGSLPRSHVLSSGSYGTVYKFKPTHWKPFVQPLPQYLIKLQKIHPIVMKGRECRLVEQESQTLDFVSCSFVCESLGLFALEEHLSCLDAQRTPCNICGGDVDEIDNEQQSQKWSEWSPHIYGTFIVEMDHEFYGMMIMEYIENAYDLDCLILKTMDGLWPVSPRSAASSYRCSTRDLHEQDKLDQLLNKMPFLTMHEYLIIFRKLDVFWKKIGQNGPLWFRHHDQHPGNILISFVPQQPMNPNNNTSNSNNNTGDKNMTRKIKITGIDPGFCAYSFPLAYLPFAFSNPTTSSANNNNNTNNISMGISYPQQQQQQRLMDDGIVIKSIQHGEHGGFYNTDYLWTYMYDWQPRMVKMFRKQKDLRRMICEQFPAARKYKNTQFSKTFLYFQPSTRPAQMSISNSNKLRFVLLQAADLHERKLDSMQYAVTYRMLEQERQTILTYTDQLSTWIEEPNCLRYELGLRVYDFIQQMETFVNLCVLPRISMVIETTHLVVAKSKKENPISSSSSSSSFSASSSSASHSDAPIRSKIESSSSSSSKPNDSSLDLSPSEARSSSSSRSCSSSSSSCEDEEKDEISEDDDDDDDERCLGDSTDNGKNRSDADADDSHDEDEEKKETEKNEWLLEKKKEKEFDLVQWCNAPSLEYENCQNQSHMVPAWLLSNILGTCVQIAHRHSAITFQSTQLLNTIGLYNICHMVLISALGDVGNGKSGGNGGMLLFQNTDRYYDFLESDFVMEEFFTLLSQQIRAYQNNQPQIAQMAHLFTAGVEYLKQHCLNIGVDCARETLSSFAALGPQQKLLRLVFVAWLHTMAHRNRQTIYTRGKWGESTHTTNNGHLPASFPTTKNTMSSSSTNKPIISPTTTPDAELVFVHYANFIAEYNSGLYHNQQKSMERVVEYMEAAVVLLQNVAGPYFDVLQKQVVELFTTGSETLVNPMFRVLTQAERLLQHYSTHASRKQSVYSSSSSSPSSFAKKNITPKKL